MSNFITKYLFLDAEYGGVSSNGQFSADCSILELYLEVVSPSMEVLGALDLKIKPANEQYVVTAQGLKANKIDLIAHDQIALNENQAKEKLHQFLKQHSNDGKVRLIPVGKGITGDIFYLTQQKFISKPNWEKFCSVENIEIGSLALILKVLQKLPQTTKPSTGKMSNSLEALGHHFKCPLVNLHSAKGDVILGKLVFAELCKLLDYLPGVR